MHVAVESVVTDQVQVTLYVLHQFFTLSYRLVCVDRQLKRTDVYQFLVWYIAYVISLMHNSGHKQRSGFLNSVRPAIGLQGDNLYRPLCIYTIAYIDFRRTIIPKIISQRKIH